MSWADELSPSLAARTRRATITLPARGTGTVRRRSSRVGGAGSTSPSCRCASAARSASRLAPQRRSAPTVLRVHPPFKSRDEAELLIRRARILEVGLRSARGVGGGTEFEQLRDYTPDDEFRRVDWAASARAGKPIVRTYRPERNQTVIVMLDNGRLMAAQVADAPRLEHAMDAAIMLTHVATRLGDRVGMVTFDAQPRAIVPAARHREQTARITEAVYELEPALVESDYRGAFATMLARFRRRSLIVVLSDLVGPAMEESLLPALPLLVRRHLVVVGAVRDPAVAGWAAADVRRRRRHVPEGRGDRGDRPAAARRQPPARRRRDRGRRRPGSVRGRARRRLPAHQVDGSTVGTSPNSPVIPDCAARRPNPNA